jgi:hypothetical protein
MTIKNNKTDKMRYQYNTIAYLLVMLSALTGIIALFTLINYDKFDAENATRVVPDMRVALEIGIGIVVLLSTFLAAEKVKFYQREWSYFGLPVLALINFLRLFNLPLYAFQKGWIPQSTMFTAMIELAITSGLLAIGALISIAKVYRITNYLKELNKNGNNPA